MTKANGSQSARRVVKGEPGMRSNGSAHNGYTNPSDDSDSDISQENEPRALGTQQGEYKAGAIKHISLENFVTYDRISVSPGPHMNMIIGPNGTGKSTIVCAIALGLGEKPSILGRAKDLGEFVKHGHEQAHVQITLAGTPDLTVHRTINRDNSSVWRLNGRTCTAGDVARATKALHVQVSSLCQFLPQDRVVEFSKLTPQALLRETLSAVGRDDLLKVQAELADTRRKERALLTEDAELQGDAQTLHKAHASLARDVQRWREQKEAEAQVRVLAALAPVARYSAAKEAYDAAKLARRTAQQRYQQAADGAHDEAIAQVEQRVAQAEAERRKLADERAALERGARGHVAKLSRLDAEQRDLRGELESVRGRARVRREKIAELRGEVARLTAALGSAPPEPSDDISQVRAEKLEASNALVALQDEQQALARTGRRVSADLAARAEQLRVLDDVATQRRMALRRFSEDTYRALEWLEQHRGEFAQHVFSPTCLEATVRDARYAAILETLLSGGTLRTFVVQCEADYHVFAHRVIDGQRLRVDVVCLRRTMDDFHAPETLRALGFDGYALDFVTAPRPVLAALCDRDHLHEVPVALGPVANEQVLAQGLCKQYVAAGTHYSVTRARYGSRAASVTTSRTRPHARLLSADDDEAREARERCSQEMDALRDRLQDNERAMKALAKRDQTARDKHRRLAAQEEQLRAARDAQLAEMRAWERRKIHLESKTAQLESLVAEERRDAPQGAQRERRRIEQQLAENAARRAELLAALAHTLAQSAEALHALALAGLRHVRFQHALSCVRAQAERHRQAAQAARDALDQASDELARAKAHATECLAETRAATEHMDDDERQRVRDAQAQRASATCAEVEAELAALRQRLRMAEHSGLSARVIEEHARREAQLADNRKRRELAAQQLHAVRRKKRRLRAAWEQPLVEIVGGVAASFARMFDAVACAGDVLVRRADDGAVAGELEDSPRDEDYGAWGIEIRVAFRANEALQPLDSHRQSGGERAVATIVYLQALQALVAAPFRVVDEINQGMDPRNERMAHALIVDTACQPDGPQYFLITPKLLPGLAYHPRMTVLCIFNGEWQPESFNPATYIANARSQAAA